MGISPSWLPLSSLVGWEETSPPRCLGSPLPSPLVVWAVSLLVGWVWEGCTPPPPPLHPFRLGGLHFPFLDSFFLVGRSPLSLLGLGGLPSTFWLGRLPSLLGCSPPPLLVGEPLNSPPRSVAPSSLVGGLPPLVAWAVSRSGVRGSASAPSLPLPFRLGGLHFPSSLRSPSSFLGGRSSLALVSWTVSLHLCGWAVSPLPSWLTAQLTRARDTSRTGRERGDRNQQGRGTPPNQRRENKKKVLKRKEKFHKKEKRKEKRKKRKKKFE